MDGRNGSTNSRKSYNAQRKENVQILGILKSDIIKN